MWLSPVIWICKQEWKIYLNSVYLLLSDSLSVKIKESQIKDETSSESSDTDTDSSSDSESDAESSKQESETEELRLLGDMKSREDHSLAAKSSNKRKHKKSVNSAAKLADLKQEEVKIL